MSATVRQTSIQRLPSSASFSNRKVAPTPSIHSSLGDDEKAIDPNYFKQEKLNAGIQASENHDYIEAIKQFSLIKPSSTTSLYQCGCARLEMRYYNQTREAIVDLTKCLELASQTSQPSFVLEVWYKLAQAYYRIGRYDDAIRDYTELIQRCRIADDPDKTHLHKGLLGRGKTYQAMFELEAALKDMDEANKLTPRSNSYYLCCRASLYAWKHDYKKAEEDLRRASDVGCEKDSKTLLQRAIVYGELGKHDLALEDLHKAMSLTRYPIDLAEICFRSGMSELALNKKSSALRSFEQATSLHPFHAQAYFQLGMLQADKGQHKQALKAFNRAHELAPLQANILLERADVNRELEHLGDADDDHKRGMQLRASPATILTTLTDRLNKLRRDIDRHGASAYSHLELAMAHDGLLNQKKHSKSKMEHFQQATLAYRTTIETDNKHLYPQARALLILCHQKMHALVEAHELHLNFYDVLAENPDAIHHWKAYLVEIEDKMASNTSEPYLTESVFSKLVHIESNRRKRIIDEDKCRNDIDDKHENQLAFYRRLRIDLSNILAAITIVSKDRGRTSQAAKDTPHEVDRFVNLLGNQVTSMSEIEAVLRGSTRTNAKARSEVDSEVTRMRFRGFGNVRDTIDQVDVAQLVARHLCTRYRSQLVCLVPTPHDSDVAIARVEKTAPSSKWWKCCASRPTPEEETVSMIQTDVVGSVARFAVAFVVHSINTETTKISSSQRTPRNDALATRLVLIICRAHRVSDETTTHKTKFTLPINRAAVVQMLDSISEPDANDEHPLIEWDLYEFFRAPGVCFYSNGDSGEKYLYHSGASMKADVYGFRLGAREEIDSWREKHRKERLMPAK